MLYDDKSPSAEKAKERLLHLKVGLSAETSGPAFTS